MTIFITFLEGIITFISPCMLPMLPIYISYFAGETTDNKKTSLKNSLGFVLGFSVVFILLGAFAGTLGSFFNANRRVIAVVSGIIMVIFGLHYMGVLSIKALNKVIKVDYQPQKNGGFFSAVVFGVIFSIGWTPCVGIFLGSALAVAASSTSVFKGSILLLSFSLGLGIPFIITAGLIEQFKTVFDFIKKNYKTINIISGVFLVVAGVLMMSGILEKILASLSRII